MPMDPFFTSKVTFRPEEEIHRKTAYAKAVQLRINTSKMRRKDREKFFKRLAVPGDNRLRNYARIAKKNAMPIESPGHPAMTGFKPAKKKWTEASRLKRPPVERAPRRLRTRTSDYQSVLESPYEEQLEKGSAD